MESKGVAIPYIIALVIGIIVLVFVVYWIYRLFSAPQISVEECKARMLQWCSMCKGLDWASDGTKISDFVGPDCAKVLSQKFGIVTTNDCNDDVTTSKSDCKKVGFSE